MVWALGLDDFKGTCGEGKYPLLRTITNVLNDGDNCSPPTTTITSPTSVAPTTSPANPPQTTKPPLLTTTLPTPTTTKDNSGSGGCRPTHEFENLPGMKQWCIENCALGHCPAANCIDCETSHLSGPRG